MRQQKLECTNEEKINEFLTTAKTGFLGLVDGKHPYVVPLNFVYYQGSIYVHGASEGRKIDILQDNRNACFTVSEDFGTMVHPVPAHTDTAFMSVMVFGSVEFVEDLEEATGAMQAMLNKYVPGYYNNPLAASHVEKYRSSLGSKTAVIKITPDKLTAKENALNDKMNFKPGRNVIEDL
ncbi:pyridoxamine 5'-phosphate oxidase family protein [Cytobacillus sp. FJAT-54145]|uniref:Pyridoxamine 5'-phosphate oxidase family protein n=1 Tax=Cytobacillus spartinae TaxID=3299023 RepID=A0ABW6K6U6_9BACI